MAAMVICRLIAIAVAVVVVITDCIEDPGSSSSFDSVGAVAVGWR